jgi:exosome complex RNA-binding protein Rrp42 (RNase PH superfamily)
MGKYYLIYSITLMDPTDEEETLSSSQMTIMLDHLGNLCGMYKVGESMSKQEISHCISIAKVKNEKIVALVQGE